MNPELIFFSCVFFIFGSLLGSFCNVVILRVAKGKSVVFPPSECPNCHHHLSPLDLIPIFGWILLSGKCRYCSSSISIQYPLVETAVALTLLFSFLNKGFSPGFIGLASWCIFTIIASIMFFRDEARTIGPFIYPILYYFPLKYFFSHSINVQDYSFALSMAFFSTLLLRWRKIEIYYLGWFGVGCIGLLGSGFSEITMGVLLLALSIIPASLFRGKKYSEGEIFRFLLLCWTLTGIIFNFSLNTFTF
ncbi:MAG: prepilin peptidase [Candidatus Riflebacteria bacterium]|nr:prepilin peptidase [Candidatus Riflebacteria bacterium]